MVRIMFKLKKTKKKLLDGEQRNRRQVSGAQICKRASVINHAFGAVC